MNKIIIKKLALLTIVSLFGSSFGVAGQLDRFYGKYLVKNPLGNIQFLVDSKGKTRLLSDNQPVWDVEFRLISKKSNFGPDALPLAVITVTWGSDEQTMMDVFTLGFEKDGSKKNIILLSGFSTEVDGPNETAGRSFHGADIFYWNKSIKKFQSIK